MIAAVKRTTLPRVRVQRRRATDEELSLLTRMMTMRQLVLDVRCGTTCVGSIWISNNNQRERYRGGMNTTQHCCGWESFRNRRASRTRRTHCHDVRIPEGLVLSRSDLLSSIEVGGIELTIGPIV